MRGSSGAGWSSLAARRAHNPKVVGSNPTPATKSKFPEQYQVVSLIISTQYAHKALASCAAQISRVPSSNKAARELRETKRGVAEFAVHSQLLCPSLWD
jgi:hypothetical protein